MEALRYFRRRSRRFCGFALRGLTIACLCRLKTGALGRVGMESRKRVALLIETSNAYARGLLEGVTGYMRRHEPWSIFLPEQERGAAPPTWLSNWRGDGIIARIENDEIARAVRKSKSPAVDVSAARALDDIPWVETDDKAISELAAQHLLERGFRSFGFCGVEGFNWSVWREHCFVRCVEASGGKCDVYNGPRRDSSTYSWNREQANLRKWLAHLPKPVGIMACFDIRAQQLLDACREGNIAVPEQVAVIGVDNDRLLCDLAMPPLSSVAPDSYRSGYEAASLLDKLMSGEQIPAEAHLIKPIGIETRQSTDISAIMDPDVAVAVRYIREHACTGINVGDVLKQVPVARGALETRFQKLLGRTPHEEIVRFRIARVKQLLAETDLTLGEIASRTGYRHVEYLTVAFKKQVGITPSKYREERMS